MDKAGNCVYNTFHTADHSSAVFIGPASQVFCIRRSEDSDRQLFYSGCGSQRYFIQKIE